MSTGGMEGRWALPDTGRSQQAQDNRYHGLKSFFGAEDVRKALAGREQVRAQ